MKSLKNTKETDFIYTISVQPHGKYLSDLSELENIYVQVESANIEMTEEECVRRQAKETDYMMELLLKNFMVFLL